MTKGTKNLWIAVLGMLVAVPAITAAQDTAAGTTETVITPAPGIAPEPTPASEPGQAIKISNPNMGYELSTPNVKWIMNVAKDSIALTHEDYFDAVVRLKRSQDTTVGTLEGAYDKRKQFLKSYMPDARFIKEKDTVTIGGSTPAISMIYENPAAGEVSREILFVHKGQPYELVFKAKKQNFQKVKDDFAHILHNLKLY